MPIKKSFQNPNVVLDADGFFDGKLVFSDSLQIDGKFTGIIESPGFLFINENAEVNADIKVGVLAIAGTVNGDIEAKEQLLVLSTGKIIGNVKARQTLKIDDGAVLEGQVDMIQSFGNVDIFSTSLSQLKKSLVNEQTKENL